MRNLFFLVLLSAVLAAQARPDIRYTVRAENPGSHRFHVVLHMEGLEGPTVDLRMPAWMPGYYQLLDYAKALSGFNAQDAAGKPLSWESTGDGAWRVALPAKGAAVIVAYDIFANTSFAARSLLDSAHGFIAPTGVFLYPDGYLQNPVTVAIELPAGWDRIATGLEPVAGKRGTYSAADFDILYDSPILIGQLEELPSFTVRGVPHSFIGYRMGEFDRVRFMSELKKVIEAAVELIGDIPYRHYTFLGIGGGRGGIEHLNSTTVPFSGSELSTEKRRQRVFNFLAHEYFHHYNVKRIRPIALGPFDYQRPNRTHLLWVSEGLTVYYEYRLVRLAGLMRDTDLLHDFQSNIAAYESKPGRLRQTLAQSSWDTWDDGPLGGNPDSTISFYDKGPVVGLLFDLAIRHATGNQRGLDDVMRRLYNEFYLERRRGFTDAEFRQVCEAVAGEPLPELFDYVYTVKEPDYAKYLAYGGLGIDTGQNFRLYFLPSPDSLQSAIRKSVMGSPE